MSIQDQLDNQTQEKPRFQVVATSEAPLLRPENIPQKTDARIETETVEVWLDAQLHKIIVRRGIPLEVAILRRNTFMMHAVPGSNQPVENMASDDISALQEHSDNIQQLMVASMILEPQFSYKGKSEGIAVESLSELWIQTLYDAVQAVNSPESEVFTLYHFREWATQTEEGRILTSNLYLSCKTFGVLPSMRICPDATANFRYCVDDIVFKVGHEAEMKQYEETKQKMKRPRGK